MSAVIIDGKTIAEQIRAEVEQTLKSLSAPPKMAIMQVGEDEGSTTYSKSVIKSAVKLGIECDFRQIGSKEDVHHPVEALKVLAYSQKVQGILLQRPVPLPHSETELSLLIPPDKDIDCVNPMTFGFLAVGRPKMLPCTPAAIMEILRRSGIETSGKRATIVGRSNVVGKPLLLMLSAKGSGDATVTLCHTRTRNLAEVLKSAEIVISACGSPRLITGEMLAPGAIVIDAGINWVQGKMVGDVDFESAVKVASMITPVPGGVGPVTAIMLFKNLADAAAKKAK